MTGFDVMVFLGFYLFWVVGVYTYAIVKNYEVLGKWVFNIENGYVGVCKYPRFSLRWIEHIIDVVTARRIEDGCCKLGDGE